MVLPCHAAQWLRVASALACAACTGACDDAEPAAATSSTTVASAPSLLPAASEAPGPELLYLPGSGLRAPSTRPPGLDPAPIVAAGPCLSGMVPILDSFCIDRHEATLVDARQARSVSPFFHPTRSETSRSYAHWRQRWPNSKTRLGQSLVVPEPPAWQLAEPFEVRAVSRAGVTPNGYLSADVAERACRNAGKRLCSHEEWVVACRGQQGHKYPYGETYVAGRCNVFGPYHPAAELHGDSSIHHLDPRLNLVQREGKPLLYKTGSLPACSSRWGDDAVYDMVGNLDEWVDDPDGLFVGGFYARSTKEGCDAAVSAHPRQYFDYSLGVRCCASLR